MRCPGRGAAVNDMRQRTLVSPTTSQRRRDAVGTLSGTTDEQRDAWLGLLRGSVLLNLDTGYYPKV